MTRPPVVVVGLDCPTGLQTARIFARRDIEVIGLASDPRHPCARTRACTRVIRTGKEPGEIADALQRLGTETGARPVVIPCTDHAVLGIARRRSELATRFRMAVPPPERVELLMDKARFAGFATQHGLPIPTTYIVRSGADAASVAASIAYPCVLKPALKSTRWEDGTTAKAFIVGSAGELRERHRQCSAWADVFVVQPWIEGPDSDHYTCDCYLDRDGRPLVTFTTRKLRQWPATIGQGSLSIEHRNDVVRDQAIHTFQCAGHHGQGYLEMKYDAVAGRHLIIEANVGRPTGRSAAAEEAGVELLMTVYADLAGSELPGRRTQTFGGTKWIHLRRDAQACARQWYDRRIGVGDIVRSWRGPKAFAVLSWRDPRPFLADCRNVLGTILGKRTNGAARSGTAGDGRASSDVEDGGAEAIHGSHDNEPGPETSPARFGSFAMARRALETGVPRPPRAPVVDFDVHGVLGVRVLDASPPDLETVARQIGPPGSLEGRSPDMIICFVDEVPSPPLTLIDGRTGYAEDGVYFLDGADSSPVALVKPGEGWGETLVVCRRGAHAVPTLSTSVDLAALAKGWIGLRASAWVVRGRGVLAAGATGSAETGALLAACERGARPVGDERVLLSGDGSFMLGLGRPIVGRDWHLAQLSPATTGAHAVRRALARATPPLAALADRLGNGEHLARYAPTARSLVDRLRRGLEIEIPTRRLCPAGGARSTAPVDALVLLEAHRDTSVVARPIASSEAAARLANMTEAGLLPALRTHLAFEYALGRGGWQGAREAPVRAAHVLAAATANVRCFTVRHPYPCSLDALHDAIAGLVPPPSVRRNGRRTTGRLARPTAEHGPERRSARPKERARPSRDPRFSRFFGRRRRRGSAMPCCAGANGCSTLRRRKTGLRT